MAETRQYTIRIPAGASAQEKNVLYAMLAPVDPQTDYRAAAYPLNLFLTRQQALDILRGAEPLGALQQWGLPSEDDIAQTFTPPPTASVLAGIVPQREVMVMATDEQVATIQHLQKGDTIRITLYFRAEKQQGTFIAKVSSVSNETVAREHRQAILEVTARNDGVKVSRVSNLCVPAPPSSPWCVVQIDYPQSSKQIFSMLHSPDDIRLDPMEADSYVEAVDRVSQVEIERAVETQLKLPLARYSEVLAHTPTTGAKAARRSLGLHMHSHINIIRALNVRIKEGEAISDYIDPVRDPNVYQYQTAAMESTKHTRDIICGLLSDVIERALTQRLILESGDITVFESAIEEKKPIRQAFTDALEAGQKKRRLAAASATTQVTKADK